jgi:hypothetical protein
VGAYTHRAETRLEKGDTAMEQKTTSHASSLSPIWEHLETFIRELVGVLFVGIGFILLYT